MKRALIFAGGGSRGSYELGAWRALEELNEKFDIACGTSIGSINACLYAQRDYKLAAELWHSITASDVMNDALSFEASIESFMEQKDLLVKFLKTYVKNSGADITPLKQKLAICINEEKFFSSDIAYGLMCVKFPTLEPVEKTKANIERGSLQNWVLASASLFPAFPLCTIGEDNYIDGGYYDSVPASTAFRLGADEAVVIHLKETQTSQNDVFYSHPLVKNISPARSLGAVLDFSREVLDKNEQLGYLDTMKAYGKYSGIFFTFTNKSVKRYENLAARYVRELTLLSVAELEKLQNQITKNVIGTPYINFLKEKSFKAYPEPMDIFIAAVEDVMEELKFDPKEVYDMRKVIEKIKGALLNNGFCKDKRSVFFKAFSDIESLKQTLSEHKSALSFADNRAEVAYASLFRHIKEIDNF